MSMNGVAVYIRLSQTDEETGKGKDESNSVGNQRGLINRFLDGREELALLPRMEFVDDGYTGTNMNRPAFKEMIRLIRDGDFNVCITKDFSRFARDYVELGDYIECVFPFLGVRYISVNDGYDSDDYKGTTGGIETAFRGIVYDVYSKDLSSKIKSAKIQSAKKGKRVGGLPCFGYMPDPDRKGHDVIDPYAVPVVRRIFDLALSGSSVTEICNILNRESIMPPGKYRCIKHPGSWPNRFKSLVPLWNHNTVGRILENEIYTGAAVHGRWRAKKIGSSQVVGNPREDRIIVRGMHTPIVSNEEYERVQELIHSGRKMIHHERSYPLKSMLYCGYCNLRLKRCSMNNPRFYCEHTYDKSGWAETSHPFRLGSGQGKAFPL